MKYTKPPAEEWILESDYRRSVYDFLRSLPAEFEIVEPGNVQVRWPEGWMKWRLCELAKMARASGETAIANDVADALWEMAAIAPEEKKKRKMAAWQFGNDVPLLFYIGAEPIGNDPRWRKVGECEVSE